MSSSWCVAFVAVPMEFYGTFDGTVQWNESSCELMSCGVSEGCSHTPSHNGTIDGNVDHSIDHSMPFTVVAIPGRRMEYLMEMFDGMFNAFDGCNYTPLHNEIFDGNVRCH